MAETLRKIIYLDKNFVLAHFLLGMLLRNQDKIIQSKKHLNTALRLLNNMQFDKILEAADGLTAGRLQSIINSML
jgi:chemotaxis protein methyltransferase CheR